VNLADANRRSLGEEIVVRRGDYALPRPLSEGKASTFPAVEYDRRAVANEGLTPSDYYRGDNAFL